MSTQSSDVGAEDLGTVFARLAEQAARAEEYLDLARRAKADFINYQQRVARDKQDWSRQTLEGFVRELDSLRGDSARVLRPVGGGEDPDLERTG